MTKKERTIRACRELAAKYREPEGEKFFSYADCPLCLMHYCCGGCPLANEDGFRGCGKFRTYQKAVQHSQYNQRACKTFNARAAFFDKIIPILEEIPASRFTKKGWKYFDELDRRW